MHYDSELITPYQKLKIVVYKHEAGDLKRKKNGLLSRKSVRYEISSIQECSLFPPRILSKILEDPYKFIGKSLDDLPFEEWYLMKLDIDPEDPYIKFIVSSVENVSLSENDLLKVH